MVDLNRIHPWRPSDASCRFMHSSSPTNSRPETRHEYRIEVRTLKSEIQKAHKKTLEYHVDSPVTHYIDDNSDSIPPLSHRMKSQISFSLYPPIPCDLSSSIDTECGGMKSTPATMRRLPRATKDIPITVALIKKRGLIFPLPYNRNSLQYHQDESHQLHSFCNFDRNSELLLVWERRF